MTSQVRNGINLTNEEKVSKYTPEQLGMQIHLSEDSSNMVPKENSDRMDQILSMANTLMLVGSLMLIIAIQVTSTVSRATRIETDLANLEECLHFGSGSCTLDSYIFTYLGMITIFFSFLAILASVVSISTVFIVKGVPVKIHFPLTRIRSQILLSVVMFYSFFLSLISTALSIAILFFTMMFSNIFSETLYVTQSGNLMQGFYIIPDYLTNLSGALSSSLSLGVGIVRVDDEGIVVKFAVNFAIITMSIAFILVFIPFVLGALPIDFRLLYRRTFAIPT